MIGEWEDSIRYVGEGLEETPRVKLEAKTCIEIDDDAQYVSLSSRTEFPTGKTLEMHFTGTRVEEAYGLKNVVKLVREGGPIVLLASEHPALEDQSSFDTIIVREVLAETGWGHWYHRGPQNEL